MKTVGEFKESGLEFVEGDERSSIHKGHGNVQMTKEMAFGTNKDDKTDRETVISFAWRENTGVKPEFIGLVEWTGDSDFVYTNRSDELIWSESSITKWRPILSQPSIAEPDTKQSAIHKAWVALKGAIGNRCHEFYSVWHVEGGKYVNGEYYFSHSDYCGQPNAKYVCTVKEFTSYCEKMAAEEKRMGIIGQNSNDGLHYDNTAQQVEALAVNHTLLQPRNPESSVKITIKNNTPHSTGSIEPVYDGSFSVCFKSSEVDGRPIFTQAMADNGELPPVGSFVDVVGKNGVELFYGEGEVNCEVLAHVENTAVIKMSYGLGCFSSDALKASDTRTDREKAIDAALSEWPVADKATLEIAYDFWRVGEI